MKKMLFLMVAAVAMLAVSCSKEDSGISNGDNFVTFKVTAPELATRALGDGTTAQTLHYAVYDAQWNHIAALDGTTSINITADVKMELIDGKVYNFIFWAQNADAPYTFDAAGKKMTVNYTDIKANNEKLDGFYAKVENMKVQSGITKTVELFRPFAQLNVATLDWDTMVKSGETFDKTEVKVKAYNTLDFVSGAVSGEEVRTFNFETMPTETLAINGKSYKWMAMNYLLVNEKELVKVTFNANNTDVAEKEWDNVPVERNHRTHILGNLLTSSVDFEVIIRPAFEEPANDYVDDVDALLAAVADATNGDVITVAPGTYPVVLDITGAKNFTLKAAKEGEVIIAGVDHQTNGTPSTVTFEGITFDNSIVTTRAEGGWFTGTAQNIAPCVGAWGGHFTFDDCKFIVAGTSGRETGIMTWWTTDLVTFKFNKCVFEGKENHASARAMQIYGKVDMEVNNCTFTTAKDYTLKYVAGEGNVAVFNGNKVENSENFVELGSSAYPGDKYTVKINNTTLGTGVNHYVVANPENQTIYIDNKLDKLVSEVVEDVASAEELTEAIKNVDASKTTVINVATGEYTMPSGLNNNVTLNCAEGTVFTGQSNLNISGATVIGATFSNPTGSATRNTINGTFKGCTFDGSNASRYNYAGETVVFEDCVFSGDLYGVHFDGGENDVIFRNCTISGFNALGSVLTSVTFEGCTFVGNGRSDYNGANLWGSAKLVNCEFTFDGTTANEWIDCIGADKTYEFENCTVNGVAYTADNYKEFDEIFSRNDVAIKINGVECVW